MTRASSRHCWAVLLLGTLTFFSLPGCTQSPGSADGKQPSPEKLLRKMADYLAGLPAVSCQMNVNVHAEANGMDNRMTTKATVRAERPRRFAMILEEGAMGMTLICDGKQFIQYVPALNCYTVQEMPESLAELSDSEDPLGAMGGLTDLGFLADGEVFYKQLMEGVTESEYLGTESVDGVACHHCRFVQPELTWDIWIEAGGRPIVHKVVPDMSGQFDEMAGGPMQDASFDILVTFTDWDTSPDFTDADFAFTPPESAEEVDSFFEAMGGDEGPHPLLGQPAPPFETVDLAGQPVNLRDHLNKDVVILDFWATWCGPCVHALPIIAGVADEYEDRGVVLYAVNQEEDVETISKFLAEEQLDVPIAMDADGVIGDLYGVNGIPQTVVIGKDGKVQVVHVGFMDGMEKQLSAELDDLLEGKDLAGAALAEAEEKAEKRSAAGGHVEPAGTALAWSVPGGWTGVAVDAASDTIIAIGSGGEAIAVAADGTTQRRLTLDGAGTLLRLADLVGGGDREFVTFETWSAGIRAFAADGTLLWDYPRGQGIDDVWAADLNGDGRDEVIVGYNGGTGLHVLDHQGTLLWKNTELGNVWHVSAGDFNGDGATDVVTTSALGALHVFDANGSKLKDIHVSFYANMVRMAPAADAGGAATAIVTGSGDDGEVIQAVDFDGDERWSTDLPGLGVDHVDDAAVAGPARWAAVAMRGGLVHVVDLETGQLVACATDQGGRPQVAWLPRADAAPLLLVATGNELNAFEITPTDLAAEVQ